MARNGHISSVGRFLILANCSCSVPAPCLALQLSSQSHHGHRTPIFLAAAPEHRGWSPSQSRVGSSSAVRNRSSSSSSRGSEEPGDSSDDSDVSSDDSDGSTEVERLQKLESVLHKQIMSMNFIEQYAQWQLGDVRLMGVCGFGACGFGLHDGNTCGASGPRVTQPVVSGVAAGRTAHHTLYFRANDASSGQTQWFALETLGLALPVQKAGTKKWTLYKPNSNTYRILGPFADQEEMAQVYAQELHLRVDFIGPFMDNDYAAFVGDFFQGAVSGHLNLLDMIQPRSKSTTVGDLCFAVQYASGRLFHGKKLWPMQAMLSSLLPTSFLEIFQSYFSCNDPDESLQQERSRKWLSYMKGRSWYNCHTQATAVLMLLKMRHLNVLRVKRDANGGFVSYAKNELRRSREEIEQQMRE